MQALLHTRNVALDGNVSWIVGSLNPGIPGVGCRIILMCDALSAEGQLGRRKKKKRPKKHCSSAA